MSKTPLSDIYGGAQSYFQLQGRYLQLKYARVVSDLAERGLKTLVITAFGGAAAVFFSIALALWLGKLFQSLPAGFTCVGAFYLLALAVWYFISSRQTGNIKDRVVRELDLGIAGYNELVKEQEQIQPRLEAEKENLQKKLEELKQAIAEIEEKFGGRGEKNEEHPSPARQVGNRVLSTAVNVLLDAFVLPKAGIVKRAVLPMVANAVIKSKFFNSGKLGNLISRIRGKT